MNKKFSTLLCASLLFSSAFTAQAEDLSGALKGGDATEMSVGFYNAEGSLSIKNF